MSTVPQAGHAAVAVESPAVARTAARSEARRFTTALLGIDLGMLTAAGVAAHVGATAAGVPVLPFAWTAVAGAITLAVLGSRGSYRPRLSLDVLDSLRDVAVATAIAAMLVLVARELLQRPDELTSQAVRTWLFTAFVVGTGRVAFHWAYARARREGETLRPTLIIGAGRVGQLLADRLLARPELGLRPIGFLDKDPLDGAGNESSLRVLGASWDLEDVVARHDVEHVIISFSTAPSEVLLRLFHRCEQLGVEVSLVPRLFERVSRHLTIDHIGGLPLLTTRSAHPKGWQFAIKYTVDRVVAALLFLVSSPVIIAAAVAVRVSLGRPIFFRQRRVGLDGREFEMLKFRTMHGTPVADGEADAAWARAQLGTAAVAVPLRVAADDRRSRVGAFLRRTSVDELPQLFNVLRGEMSIVGPRPERTHYVDLFREHIYRYGDRHRVKAGLTGWAQVNGLRGTTSLADRVEWDNYYIENFSLWLDFKIVLRTALAVAAQYRRAA